MIQSELNKKNIYDEADGEKLINKFRFVIAFLYVLTVILFAVLRKAGDLPPFPAYGFIPNSVFLLFSVFLFFYLQKKEAVHKLFKYFCVIMDMTIISASIWVGCTYPELDPPIAYLSIWALFYIVLILLGAFRNSIRCAFFSGIYAGVLYLIVVFMNGNAIDLPYFFIIDDKKIPVNFPLYNESLRVLAMFVTGAVTGVACKRHQLLLNNMIENEETAAEAASKTVEQTQSMAKILQKSTDDIFLSSKEIFSTANNQAASVQEIEATMKENMKIAADIADKTADVWTIASKMENDVNRGFLALKRNIEQFENIKNKNNEVISGIISLGNKISKIHDIITAIKAITDQTKVIAFNAALEAASAGEQGKRFSIVSREVNRLADDIASLTRQIRLQADEIQGSSSSLIASSEESTVKITDGSSLIRDLEYIFMEISQGAETTASQAQTITVSTQKQQKSTEQINIAISDISKGLASFIQSTKVATSSAGDLSQMIQELDAYLN
ncbi:MAG: methyl-accepting chemotaxis protein [Treponema sp.]|jgi:methyl-accepting chemotaxis protein|nr:methyl-accepting chemotaxis protein [Treponema sp.]